jgi:SAM-dependent methyltransferase
VLGQKKAKVVVLSQPLPTALQSLVGKVSQELGERELYELHQPIEGVEFEKSWPIVRKCHDRLQMMLAFLNSFMPSGSRMSVVDLGCSYGWFVAEFAKRGHQAMGIDSSPAALKIGQIAYGLSAEQAVKVDLQAFFARCDRTFDVVLLLSILHHFVPKSHFGRAEEILKRVDAITGSVLFLDTGQSHEKWFHRSLPDWDDDFIIKFIQRHTSFKHVIPLGADSDNVGGYRKNFNRTLFACVRS